MYIASQIIVGIADIILICSMQMKSKSKLLIVQVLSCSLFALHYFFLFAFLGGAFELIDVARLLTFYFLAKKDSKKWNIVAGCTFISLSILSAVLAWDAWYCFIPLIGITAVNIALLQKNMVIIKGAYSVHSISSCIYMFLIASYVGGIIEAIVLIGTLVGFLIQIFRDKKSGKKLSFETAGSEKQLKEISKAGDVLEAKADLVKEEKTDIN